MFFLCSHRPSPSGPTVTTTGIERDFLGHYIFVFIPVKQKGPHRFFPPWQVCFWSVLLWLCPTSCYSFRFVLLIHSDQWVSCSSGYSKPPSHPRSVQGLSFQVSFAGNMRERLGISLVVIELPFGWGGSWDKLGTTISLKGFIMLFIFCCYQFIELHANYSKNVVIAFLIFSDSQPKEPCPQSPSKVTN